MGRKHILHDSVLIFLFLGSAVPLIFFLLIGSNPYIDLDTISGHVVLAFLIMYLFSILFGSLFAIPAAILNYVLIKTLIKYGYFGRFLKSSNLTFLLGFCNGLFIGSILFVVTIFNAGELELGATVFTHLPCIVSSVVFCLYQRKEYLTSH